MSGTTQTGGGKTYDLDVEAHPADRRRRLGDARAREPRDLGVTRQRRRNRSPHQIERSSSSASFAVTGRGLAFAPGRATAASATSASSPSGTPKSRRRSNPPRRASSSTRAAASSTPSAPAKLRTASGATAVLKRSAGGRQSAFIAPCDRP